MSEGRSPGASTSGVRALRESMEQQATLLQQHMQQQQEQMQMMQEQFASLQQSVLSISQQASEAMQHASQAAQSANTAAEQAQALQHAALHAEPPGLQEEAPSLEAEPVLPPPPPIFASQPSQGFDLPRSLKLERPPSFEGQMDGDTVSAFIHKLDVLFKLAALNDTVKQATYAVTCLDKAAYTWYIAQSYSLDDLTWPTLKAALFEHFKPVDYTFQTRQALARCRQTGDVRGYVRAFRLAYVRCTDVTADEAKFRFIDGLKPEEQRHTRLAQPVDFHQAAAIAEQIGATMQRGRAPYPQQTPMQMGTQQGHTNPPRSNPRPSNGGTGGYNGQRRFNGTCNFCGIRGHKERDCRKKKAAMGQGQCKTMGAGDAGGSNGCGGSGGCPAVPVSAAIGCGFVVPRARGGAGARVADVDPSTSSSESTIPLAQQSCENVPVADVASSSPAPTCVGCVSSASTCSRLLVLPVMVTVGTASSRGKSVGALVDSGATNCFVGQDVVDRFGMCMVNASHMSVTLADGSVVSSSHVCQLPITIAGQLQQVVDCRVVPVLSNDVVLGMDWLQQWNPAIDWIGYSLTFSLPDNTVVAVDALPQASAAKVELCSLDSLLKTVNGGQPAWFALVRNVPGSVLNMELSNDSGAGESAAPKSRWDILCERFPDLFKDPGTPHERNIKHRIDLVEGARPPAQRMYRMSPAELAEVRRQLDEYLSKGWVRPSTSPYGAPILFVRKKDGTLRMCIDYRALNKQTKLDRYPLPRIDDLLDRLCRAKVISSIDLAQGYHQVAIEPGHEHRTAFVSRFGLYEFTVVPFGLCNAPSTFQRLMHDVFHDALDQFVLVYLDDILVFSESEDEHERHLAWVFQRLIDNKLCAKRKKCEFGKRAVKYLGHIVGNGELRVDTEKVSAVTTWERPRDVKSVQQFLGFANYYNRFIPNFAALAAPISNLLADSKEFEWGSTHDRSFEALKSALTSAPVLVLPDFTRDFVVQTDASDVAVGGTLQQWVNGELRPVCYYSRKLQSAERNYSVSDRELLAIYNACVKWRCYLQGKHTLVYTDHEPLKYLHSQPNVSSRQARWLERLGELSLEIVYVPGRDNVVADVLSRYGCETDPATDSAVAAYDTADVSLHPVLREWLRVVAPGVGLSDCLVAARQGLAAGRTLASLVCKKCQTVHLDQGEYATRVHRMHLCGKCKHTWSVSPPVQSNPLAVLSPSLVNGGLYVSRLPDQQLQLGAVDLSSSELGSIVVEPSFLDRVATAQAREDDREMSRFRARATGAHADFAFRTVHGHQLVFRVVSDGYRLVIPQSCRQLLLDEAHNSAVGGHLGVAKTLKLLGARVWWPHMLRSVKSHVKKCQVCQRQKDSTQAAPGLLQPLPVPEKRFSCWSMDFVTDLPVCNGFNGIMTVVDRLTKYCKLIPIFVGEGTLTAERVASLFFQHIVVHFGVPREVLHDRDPRFTGSFWQELWRQLGTRTVFTSSYHPQTDGQTERTHRTLEQLVRCMLAESQLDESCWCQYLPLVELSINNAVQESTGKSPSELVFGERILLPLDLALGTDVSNPAAVDVAARVPELVQQAQQQMQRAQLWQKRYYDRHHRDLSFAVGDQVLLSTRNLNLPGSRKFKQRWVGPFTVMSTVGATSYRLDLAGRFARLHPVFHVSLLRQFQAGGSSAAPPAPIELDGELEYEVEKIVGHRQRGRSRQYLVRWKGYDLSEDTWLGEADLQHAVEILLAYKSSAGLG